MGRPSPSRLVGATLGFVTVSYSMQQTAVFPALPSIRADLHTSTSWAVWVYTSYMLTTVASTAVMGRLGDQFGKRRMLLVALGVFCAGSIASALAPSIAVLIIARAVQGVGGGIIPLCVSIVPDIFPRARVGPILGGLFAMLALGAGLGVVLGGLAVDQGSWRLIFAFATVSIGVTMLLVSWLVPRTGTSVRAELDVFGVILLPVGLASGLLAITQGSEWGWTSAGVVILAVGSAAVLTLWTMWERRAPAPMVDLQMLGQRTVLLANVGAMLLSFALFAPLVIVPIFLALRHDLDPAVAGRVTWGFNSSATRTGLYFLPGYIAALAASPLAGLLGRRYGTRVPLVVGATTLCVGCLAMALWNGRPWQIVIGLFAVALGSPVAASANATLVMDAVRSTETGVASGVLQVVRTIGAVIAAQVGAAILAADHLAGTSVPTLAAFISILVLCAVAAGGSVLVALFVSPQAGKLRVGAPSAIDRSAA